MKEVAAMQISVRMVTINRVLATMLVVLSLAGISVEALSAQFRRNWPVVRIFSLSAESNVPTWYSSSLLLACSFLLAVIAATKKREGARYARHWGALAVIFLYLSIDEASQIHELLNNLWDLHSILYFSWVIPFGILVLVFAIVYLPFLFHLPPRTRIRVASAGVIYVGGALGVELILGYWADVHGDETFGYTLIDWVEESMEILGASLFCSALLEYLGTAVKDLRVSIETGRGAPWQSTASHT
jgi:uncharacterized Tic20 family protein